MNKIVLGSLSLLAGLALGFIAGLRFVGSEHSKDDVMRDVPKSTERLASPRAPVSRISSEAEANSALHRLQTIAWMVENHAGSISLPPAQFGKIAPGFLTAFGLSNADGIALQNALNSARSELDRAEISKAQVSLLPDGTTVLIDIPPMPEIGARIYDQLHSAFKNVLGSEKYELFKIISQDRLDSSSEYDGFGLNKVQYRVSDPQKNGIYSVAVTQITSEGRRSTSNSYVDWTALEQNFPIVAKLYRK